MAGLGLRDALSAFQQGTAWKQHQEEIGRAQEQRAALDEANAAATGVINQQAAQHIASGAQGQYRPNESAMFKAAEARGMAFARRGRWDEFVQNEAQVAPLRVKARAAALQRYEMDGDSVALAHGVYPSLFDGKEIVGSEKIEGADGSVGLGLAPRPSKLKLKLSDGTTKELVPDELVKMVKMSLIDPQTAMKNEAMMNLERAKAEIDAAAKTAVERVKGDEARKTEGVKGKNAAGLQDRKFGHDLALADTNNAARVQIGAGNNAATLGAARIGADSRIATAEARAAGAESGGSSKRDARYGQLHTEIARVYGQGTTGLAGEGKAATDDTRKMASYADALMDADKSLSMAQAIDKSVAEWAKRNPGFKPPRSTGGLGLGN